MMVNQTCSCNHIAKLNRSVEKGYRVDGVDGTDDDCYIIFDNFYNLRSIPFLSAAARSG